MTQHLHEKVEHAVKTVESFSALLDQETKALKTADYKTFEALQEPKVLMAQAYQDAVLAFEEDLDNVKTLEDTFKKQLLAVQARFQKASDINQKALLNAKTTAERIVKLIMDAAKRSVADTGPAYSAAGIQGLSDKIPVHFKLNETL
jgi:hypothetical protein